MFLQALFLLGGSTLVLSSPSDPTYAADPVQHACRILSKTYPNDTFFPGSDRYTYENEFSWSTTSWLNPACVFCPSSEHMASNAVKLFAKYNVQFAVRGGGAIPIDNAANIGPEGILMSSSNMTSLSLSEDSSTVTVGAGIRWPQLYGFLEPHALAVNGIRIGNAGVVGFYLGGGIGFFSYEKGLGSEAVASFEVVLGDGRIVTASLTENPDLFWALRGGGNNFGYVTKIVLHTFHTDTVLLGNINYGTGVEDRYIQSMVEFSLYAGSDPASSLEGQMRFNPSVSDEVDFYAFLFYNGNNTSPPGFQNLTAPVLPFQSGSVDPHTMKTWSDMFPFDSDRGNRKIFHFMSLPSDVDAMRIATDTYFNEMRSLVNITHFNTAFSIMPITDQVVLRSGGNGGSPLGLTVSDNGVPALWMVESPSWRNGVDDQAVLAAHDRANLAIRENLAAAGFNIRPFVYLSDAQKGEAVFEGYGEENVRRLQEIRDQYDPAMVFTRLVPGGFKLAYVTI